MAVGDICSFLLISMYALWCSMWVLQLHWCIVNDVITIEHTPWWVYCWCWNLQFASGWLWQRWRAPHEWWLSFLTQGCWSQKRTKKRKNRCIHILHNLPTVFFSFCLYLYKRAQVVFQSFLMTSWDYMYDHTEDTKQRNETCTVNTTLICINKWLTDRRELTAISWASLVAAASTSNSCISTVGRKVMITCVSMACRHCGEHGERSQK